MFNIVISIKFKASFLEPKNLYELWNHAGVQFSLQLKGSSSPRKCFMSVGEDNEQKTYSVLLIRTYAKQNASDWVCTCPASDSDTVAPVLFLISHTCSYDVVELFQAYLVEKYIMQVTRLAERAHMSSEGVLRLDELPKIIQSLVIEASVWLILDLNNTLI